MDGAVLVNVAIQNQMNIVHGQKGEPMRLIDADKLRAWFESHSVWDEFPVGYIMGLIDEQPTVDAVPVIRCKDCRYYYRNEHCIRDDVRVPTDKDYYCDDAERWINETD